MADKNWQQIADECEALAAIVNLAPMHAAARAVREQADEIDRLRVAGDALAENYKIMLDDHWSAFSAAFLTAWQEARRG